MPKSVSAFVNPAMLIWARDQARLSPAAAAKAIGVTPEKLEAAEKGDLQLTFPQFLAAANAYKRAPSLFYLDEPPVGFQPIQDFRKLSGTGEDVFSPNLTAAIRRAHERRDLALQLYIDLGKPVADFALAAGINENEETLGERIRGFLEVSEGEQQGWRGKAFDNWRSKIEARDVLVFLVPELPLTEMRGAAIAENQLPLILVNSKDRTNGLTFTLLHEFCHLAIRASGVSGFDASDARTDAARVERFCNAVAGATLVPGTWLLREPLVMRKGDSKTWDDGELRAIAAHFGVSREVILRRLLTLGRTSAAFYESRRATFQKEYEELNSKKATGAPPPPVVKVSQLGRAYAQLIFQGYYDRRLTLRDVSNYFNMQVKAVPALEQAAFGLKG